MREGGERERERERESLSEGIRVVMSRTMRARQYTLDLD
ncbi:unnamed protein product [Spirodela intermedia]|uniref:Uncharacterized protein n=1 Tax=Spirodela intermedia TaxID=51605 RepID=A0ABN7EAB7_SPIIN|nr:unnamed protein product [Spirodela intermedia]